MIIINFCYPKMASKLAYSGPVSWIAEWVFFENFSYQKGGLILGGKILYCLGFKCKSYLIWFTFFYFKALNISQPSPNLWHYVVLNSLAKQLTKPNKPKTRHKLYIELWLLTILNFITTKLGYKVGFKMLNFQRVEIGLLWDISLKIVLLRFIGKSELFILKGCYIDYLYQAIWLGFLLIKKST